MPLHFLKVVFLIQASPHVLAAEGGVLAAGRLVRADCIHICGNAPGCLALLHLDSGCLHSPMVLTGLTKGACAAHVLFTAFMFFTRSIHVQGDHRVTVWCCTTGLP